MSKDDPLFPVDVIEKTQEAAKLLADHRESLSAEATRLNECIIAFENWVAQLPGRVEAAVYVDHPDHPPQDNQHGVVLGLRVARDGAQWPVSFAAVSDYYPEDPDWRPLREAKLDLKIYAIPHLPRLVQKMVAEQSELKSRIKHAADEFQRFAKQIGITKGAK